MERDPRMDNLASSMGRSWGDSDANESLTRSSESSSIIRGAFRFRMSGSGDASSLQSEDSQTKMMTRSGRFTTAALRRSRGGEDGNAYDGGREDEEEEEEEEDDDDDVRRSWTTEKEPAMGAAMRFRFNRGQDTEAMEEEEMQEEEDGGGADDSDDSFGSLGWVTRELRHLERQQLQTEDHEEDEADERDVEHSVEESVREALSLLNGCDEKAEEMHEEEHDGEDHSEEAWGENGSERRSSYYFDIVQEAMATEWQRGRKFTEDEEEEHNQDENEEEQANDEEEENENEETHLLQEEQELEADEWLEAYTAKGRVYYYNRRTRESSWTKPTSVLEREAQLAEEDDEEHHEEAEDEEPQEDEEEEEEEEEAEQEVEEEEHRQEEEDKEERAASVLQQSLGQSSSRSSTSSTSSSHNGDHQYTSHSSPLRPVASARSAHSSTNTATHTLFCCFCGSPVDGARGGGLHAHFSQCETLHFHKLTASPLYQQFQHTLVLLSEDASLRAMHYASSFPDATPNNQHDDDTTTPSEQAVRESLTLLRVKHRSSVKPLVHKTTSAAHSRSAVSSFSSVASSSTAKRPSVPKEPLASRYVALKQRPTPVAMLNVETCRHCGRSFAEGRLAKHEAVCPHVFGNETAWGRGAASIQKQQPGSGDAESSSLSQTQAQLRSLQKKQQRSGHSASLKHTLALSFQEHQASLVQCPCCKRKFAPSGAQQHIEICKTVTHRPRNHVPLLKDFAMAS